MLNQKYYQGMSVLSDRSIARKRISCWVAAFLCLDWKKAEENSISGE